MLSIGREKGSAEVRRVYREFEKEMRRGGRTKTKRRPIPKKWIIDAWYMQGGKCQRGHEDLSLYDATGDHFIALDNGGDHAPDNIVAVCRSHNSQKGALTIFEDAKKTGKTLKERLKRENL
jgi:5-methylcytosine-specific restriction endonuclease McrA